MTVDEKITFEARVYIDGVHHRYVELWKHPWSNSLLPSSRMLRGDTVWPEVVGEFHSVAAKNSADNRTETTGM